ncbi:MAG TPA: hypothetical protein VIR31_05885 [Nitrososphaeraceae archaeon]
MDYIGYILVILLTTTSIILAIQISKTFQDQDKMICKRTYLNEGMNLIIDNQNNADYYMLCVSDVCKEYFKAEIQSNSELIEELINKSKEC